MYRHFPDVTNELRWHKKSETPGVCSRAREEIFFQREIVRGLAERLSLVIGMSPDEIIQIETDRYAEDCQREAGAAAPDFSINSGQ